MPAIEHSFTEELPLQLYVDTNILIAYLVDNEPHHTRSMSLLQRFGEVADSRLVTSSLTFIEFTNAVMRERFRSALPQDMQR